MTTKELMSWISSGSETPYEVTGAEIQSILDAERTKAIKTYAENHPRADDRGLRDEAEEFRSDNMNLRKKLHLFLECERLSIRRPLAEALEIAEKADDEGSITKMLEKLAEELAREREATQNSLLSEAFRPGSGITTSRKNPRNMTDIEAQFYESIGQLDSMLEK